MDNNASYVARPTKAKIQQMVAVKKLYSSDADFYELGLVWNEEDQCYYPVYDFADTGGHNMSMIVGEVRGRGRGQEVTGAFSDLMQLYNAHCDRLKAQELNQEVEFEKLPDGSLVSFIYLDEANKVSEQY